jgi:L-rhamnose mutarotase
MNRYVFFLDLKQDDDLIQEYERYHEDVWPEIEQHILDTGVTHCEIYRVSNRLVLMVESDQEMDWEKKTMMDEQHSKTQEWELLMWNYQQAIPGFEEKGKWQLAKRIYTLNND